jgi:hypothetical protein
MAPNACSTRTRDASPAIAIEFASVFRRWANALSTTGRTSASGAPGTRVNATSADSTRGRGRNTVGGDVVREVRDELPWRRLEGSEIQSESIAEDEPDILVPGERRRERVRKREVELDRMHESRALGEVAREDPEARTDLQDDIVGLEHSEAPDDAQDVLVDQEVLPE